MKLGGGALLVVSWCKRERNRIKNKNDDLLAKLLQRSDLRLSPAVVLVVGCGVVVSLLSLL